MATDVGCCSPLLPMLPRCQCPGEFMRKGNMACMLLGVAAAAAIDGCPPDAAAPCTKRGICIMLMLPGGNCAW